MRSAAATACRACSRIWPPNVGLMLVTLNLRVLFLGEDRRPDLVTLVAEPLHERPLAQVPWQRVPHLLGAWRPFHAARGELRATGEVYAEVHAPQGNRPYAEQEEHGRDGEPDAPPTDEVDVLERHS